MSRICTIMAATLAAIAGTLPLTVEAAPITAQQKLAIDESMREWLAQTEVLMAQKTGLAQMGPTRTFNLQSENHYRDRQRKLWRIVTAHGILNAVEFDLLNGKIQEFLVTKQ